MERIVVNYLARHNYPCSFEYRTGMVDALAVRESGTGPLARFRVGSVQHDAYVAGFEHGFACWAETVATRKGANHGN